MQRSEFIIGGGGELGGRAWLSPEDRSSRYMRSATAKMCGGSDPIGRLRYRLIWGGGGVATGWW